MIPPRARFKASGTRPWVVLYLVVLRPLRRTIEIADKLSTGESSALSFPTEGGEIGDLGRAFHRMRLSLEKAMKLLEP